MSKTIQYVLLGTLIILTFSNGVVGYWMGIINRHDRMQNEAIILEGANILTLSKRLDDIDEELNEECAPAQSN